MNTASGIRSMKVHLDPPHVNIEQELEYRSLLLLVGANGTGKSFVLKTTWVMSFIAFTLSHLKGASEDQMLEISQFIFDKSFEQPFTPTGEISCTFENNVNITLKLIMGQVSDIAIVGFDDVVTFPAPKYLSSKLRLFDSISMYLKIRKDKVASGLGQEEIIGAMLEYYPLYDVMYVEGLVNNSPLILTQEQTDSLHKFDFEENISSLTADLDKCDFYVTMDTQEIKYMKTYGSGHQAMVNMLVGAGT